MRKLNLIEINSMLAEFNGGMAYIVEYFRQTGKVRLKLKKDGKDVDIVFAGCGLFEGDSSWSISNFKAKKVSSGNYAAGTKGEEFFVEFSELLILESL